MVDLAGTYIMNYEKIFDKRLVDILHRECQKKRIILGTEKVFSYLQQFGRKESQMSLF